MSTKRPDRPGEGRIDQLARAVYHEPSTHPDPANDNTSGKNRESSEENWATPTTMEAKGVAYHGKKGERPNDLTLLGQARKNEENWQTPNVEDAARKGSKEAWKEYEDENRTTQCRLRNQIHNDNWATPQASDHIEGARTAPTSNQKCLGRDMNRTWPTSRASDAEGGRITTEETNEGFRSKREKSGQYFGAKLRDAVEMKKPTQAKLNPNWVEQLMLGKDGVGWTQLPTEWID